MRLAPVALFAGILAVLPLQPVKADCSFPLAIPFCIAGAVVNAATTVVTAPFYGVRSSYAPYYGVGSSYHYGSYYRRPHYYRHTPHRYAKYYPHKTAHHRIIATTHPITTDPPEPVSAPTPSIADDASVEPPPQTSIALPPQISIALPQQR